MPFLLDVPTRIPPVGVALHLICVDVNRSAPLLYLALATPSGHQVFVAQLSWSYLATPVLQPASFGLHSVPSSAVHNVVPEVLRDASVSGVPSTPTTRR